MNHRLQPLLILLAVSLFALTSWVSSPSSLGTVPSVDAAAFNPIAQGDSPTEESSSAPISAVPSDVPTDAPAAGPTAGPSEAPNQNPTKVPTDIPTIMATDATPVPSNADVTLPPAEATTEPTSVVTQAATEDAPLPPADTTMEPTAAFTETAAEGETTATVMPESTDESTLNVALIEVTDDLQGIGR